MHGRFLSPRGVPNEGEVGSLSDKELETHLDDVKTRIANLEFGGQIDSPNYHEFQRSYVAILKEQSARKPAQSAPQPS